LETPSKHVSWPKYLEVSDRQGVGVFLRKSKEKLVSKIAQGVEISHLGNFYAPPGLI
jgi:hypothetical protein